MTAPSFVVFKSCAGHEWFSVTGRTEIWLRLTEILMALHELLIGLFSGIKLHLTYCSQSWGTVILLSCSVDAAATGAHRQGFTEMHFNGLSFLVCVSERKCGCLSVINAHLLIEMRVWMRTSCAEVVLQVTHLFFQRVCYPHMIGRENCTALTASRHLWGCGTWLWHIYSDHLGLVRWWMIIWIVIVVFVLWYIITLSWAVGVGIAMGGCTWFVIMFRWMVHVKVISTWMRGSKVQLCIITRWS